MKLAILAVLASTAAAFTAPMAPVVKTSALSATDSRREFISSAAGLAAAGVFGAVAPANAIIDNDTVQYLGGSSVVDLNNANVRVYLKMPGLYPTVAGKIVSNGPYATVSAVYSIPGLSAQEKELIKKYESRFTVTTPQADYVIDKINNGLYR
eukprot:CAMPEP_0195508938 /NCGR_PEP_ID=MMETSP0794_2-20130614/2018_1 /TAXON_ID=515487 /ORGANISM="Stephanopyxis turris, Strain CCMP 815" /LENGTH=152 /DNA_ID=CAMNT_0040636039 /DNA_START=40 /DNA_END=498 /DNA_ORIENTATION=-